MRYLVKGHSIIGVILLEILLIYNVYIDYFEFVSVSLFDRVVTILTAGAFITVFILVVKETLRE